MPAQERLTITGFQRYPYPPGTTHYYSKARIGPVKGYGMAAQSAKEHGQPYDPGLPPKYEK